MLEWGLSWLPSIAFVQTTRWYLTIMKTNMQELRLGDKLSSSGLITLELIFMNRFSSIDLVLLIM